MLAVGFGRVSIYTPQKCCEYACERAIGEMSINTCALSQCADVVWHLLCSATFRSGALQPRGRSEDLLGLPDLQMLDMKLIGVLESSTELDRSVLYMITHLITHQKPLSRSFISR